MSVILNSEKAEFFRKARQDKQLTQLELSQKAGIALRTIQDLETGRRNSFNEDTLIRLCRALELDYGVLTGEKGADIVEKSGKPRAFTIAALITAAIAAVLFIAVIAVNLFAPQKEENPGRVDWVYSGERLYPNHFNPQWEEDENGINVNYYYVKQAVEPGETVPVEIKWSYHCKRDVSRPMYFISCYTEWEPDREIRLFDGVIKNEGSDVFNFELKCPEKPGLHRLRVFFASAFAPVPSFYGAPDNQLTNPGSAPFLEFPIEVIE